MKKISLPVLTSTAIVLPAVLYARPYGDCVYGGPFTGGGMLMWIIVLMLTAVLIFFAVTVFRKGKTDFAPFQTEKDNEPLTILKKRLASGEISEEEYDRLSAKLS